MPEDKWLLHSRTPEPIGYAETLVRYIHVHADTGIYRERTWKWGELKNEWYWHKDTANCYPTYRQALAELWAYQNRRPPTLDDWHS